MYGGWRSNHLSSEGKYKGRVYMGWRGEMNECKKPMTGRLGGTGIKDSPNLTQG